MRIVFSVVGVLAVACASSCGCGKGLDVEPRPIARRITRAAVATRAIGESCFLHGRSECLGIDGRGKDAVCWHATASPHDPDGFICSRGCRRDADCPLEFACVGLGGLSHTGTGRETGPFTKFCAPRKGWVPHPAIERIRPSGAPRSEFAAPGPRAELPDAGGN